MALILTQLFWPNVGMLTKHSNTKDSYEKKMKPYKLLYNKTSATTQQKRYNSYFCFSD